MIMCLVLYLFYDDYNNIFLGKSYKRFVVIFIYVPFLLLIFYVPEMFLRYWKNTSSRPIFSIISPQILDPSFTEPENCVERFFKVSNMNEMELTFRKDFNISFFNRLIG